MNCKNIILLDTLFNSSWSREFDHSGGHALAFCARWIAAQCNVRRSCCVWEVHTSPLGALGLRFAPTRDAEVAPRWLKLEGLLAIVELSKSISKERG